MNNIMSYKEWIKDTKGSIGKPRSAALKAVDVALEKFDKVKTSPNKDAVTKALVAWQMTKGNNWKTSVRNKSNAVENLYRQLTGLGGSANMVALSHIRDESRAIVTDLFLHKKVVFRPGLLTKIAGNKLKSKVKVVKSSGKVVKNITTLSISSSSSSSTSNSAAASSRAMALSKKISHDLIPSNIRVDVLSAMSKIMPTFAVELQAACLPFVGVIFSGGSVCYSGYQVAQAAYKQENSKTHVKLSLSTEEPEAAFKALILMLERKTQQKTEKFAKGLADFGSKLASTLADGGTATNAAIGLASGLIKLLMILRIVVRDIQERNAANVVLKQPIIGVELFEANPLMGAYLICCAPTSVLVNTMLDSKNFNKPGMMDKVEQATKKHLKPLKSRARSLITEHRMYIPGLQNFPGLLKKNKKNLKDMMARNGKTGMQGLGADDFDDLSAA
jgi:hypothetical protein